MKAPEPPQFGIVGQARARQEVHGVQDQRNALLVVGNAQAVGAVAIDAVRLARAHAALVDRIHVRDQQHLLAARALARGVHHLSELGALELRVEGRRCGGLHLHLHAGLLKALGDVGRDAVQAFEVEAAGLHGDQGLQRLQQRWHFSLRTGPQGRVRRTCWRCDGLRNGRSNRCGRGCGRGRCGRLRSHGCASSQRQGAGDGAAQGMKEARYRQVGHGFLH
jgi:hypothetical protein